MGPRILLGVSGSIAAYKAVEITRLLGKRGARVQVAMTAAATKFVGPLTFEAITGQPVLVDPWTLGRGQIEHVERAHEVDLILVAPASANVLARITAGLADDALTAIILASRATVCVAPAMESGMWLNAATQANIATLQGRGVRVFGPSSGPLASGREGEGRMLEPQVLAELALASLSATDLKGRRLVLTAGPTWEALDPVRILTNRSTGAMGIALAEGAAARGAEVDLVLGPTPLEPLPLKGLRVIRVESAEDMLDAARRVLSPGCALFGVAAVSDFRPEVAREKKLKRSDPAASQLALTENPDVLATLAAALRQLGGGTVVGFAAETEADPEVLAQLAQGKLQRKGCDWVIANQVGPKRGFGGGDTEVLAVPQTGPAVPFGPGSKAQVAHFILDLVLGGKGASATP